MLRLLGFLIKILLFSLTVIVLSNWVHWRGRTISDQVELQLSHAEHAPWVEKLPTDLRNWVRKKAKHPFHADLLGAPAVRDEVSAHQSSALRPRPVVASEERASSRQAESIPASERQKLKALIRELNGVQN